jgi:acetyl esterase
VSIAVDPDMAPILQRLKAAPAPDMRALPISQARALFEQQQRPWVWAEAAMASTRDLTVPGAAGRLRARLHVPEGGHGKPATLYLHGGGWTFGSIDTHDGTMRGLAAASGHPVFGIDYRLAPEAPFPAPLDDVLAAAAHLRSGDLGEAVDPSRLALAGDSAGANLALGAALVLRDRGAPPVTAALIYGCYAPLFDTASHARLGDGAFIMRSEMMRWYWANFLGPGADAPSPYAAPLNADLAGLPPLYLDAAGLDPLVDDSTLLSAKLAEAGVMHRFDLWPGVVHGFVRLARELPVARRALTEAGRWLGRHLSPGQEV